MPWLFYFQDEDDDEGEDKLDSDFDMNKMLNQLRIDENGKEKGIEDFDDLDDEDSDDEGTGCLLDYDSQTMSQKV